MPDETKPNALYIVTDEPDTLDKPTFDFSSVPYTRQREIALQQVLVEQAGKALTQATEAEDIEALAEQHETLLKEQADYSAEHGKENPVLRARIKRLEQRMWDWEAPDIPALMAAFNAEVDKQEEFIFESVTHIPQSWLVRGAPLAGSINWQDKDSRKFLRQDKVQALRKAKQDALADSKN